MRISSALKAYGLSKGWWAAGATDARIKQVVLAKLAGNELSAGQLDKLTKAAPSPGQSTLQQMVRRELAAAGVGGGTATATATASPPRRRAATPPPPPTNLDRLSVRHVRPVQEDGDRVRKAASEATGLLTRAADIQVKAPGDYYRKSRPAGIHKSTGQPVFLMGRPVEHPSELMLAKMGVLTRWKLLRSSLASKFRPMDAHEKALLEQMFHEDDFWVEQGDGHNLMSGGQVKALINDSTSGGQEIVPYWFDEMAITFPLLHSELLPEVTIRDVPRGNSIEGGSIGNPTVSWGTAEGTALTLFTTDALVADFSTTIYPVVIGVEVGIDFMSDSPMQVGAILQENIGQSALKELDNVIANGNGTNRPQGLFLASSTNIVQSLNGGNGDLEVADAENLTFGVAKQYRAKQWNNAYVMNDTNYKRFCSVPVSLQDQRRVFGMDQQAYKMFGYPVKIQNSIANTDLAFVALAKYILYRRLGWDLRTVTEGITLAKSNTIAFIGRGRFGGKLSDGSAMAEMNDGPS